MKWLGLLLGVVAPAVWADPSSPIEIAPVDVEANVRKMLEQSGSPAGETIPVVPGVNVEDEVRSRLEGKGVAPTPAPKAKHAAVHRAPPAKEKPPVVPPKRSMPPPTKPKQAERPAPLPEEEIDFVPLPSGSITIRSVDDLDRLTKELDAARKKKATKSRE